jgi:hypothetical protein
LTTKKEDDLPQKMKEVLAARLAPEHAERSSDESVVSYVIRKDGDTEDTRRRLLFGALIGTQTEIDKYREEVARQRENSDKLPKGASSRFDTKFGRAFIGKQIEREFEKKAEIRERREAEELAREQRSDENKRADAPVIALLVVDGAMAAGQALTNKILTDFVRSKKDTWPEGAGPYRVSGSREDLRKYVLAYFQATKDAAASEAVVAAALQLAPPSSASIVPPAGSSKSHRRIREPETVPSVHVEATPPEKNNLMSQSSLGTLNPEAEASSVEHAGGPRARARRSQSGSARQPAASTLKNDNASVEIRNEGQASQKRTSAKRNAKRGLEPSPSDLETPAAHSLVVDDANRLIPRSKQTGEASSKRLKQQKGGSK